MSEATDLLFYLNFKDTRAFLLLLENELEHFILNEQARNGAKGGDSATTPALRFPALKRRYGELLKLMADRFQLTVETHGYGDERNYVVIYNSAKSSIPSLSLADFIPHTRDLTERIGMTTSRPPNTAAAEGAEGPDEGRNEAQSDVGGDEEAASRNVKEIEVPARDGLVRKGRGFHSSRDDTPQEMGLEELPLRNDYEPYAFKPDEPLPPYRRTYAELSSARPSSGSSARSAATTRQWDVSEHSTLGSALVSFKVDSVVGSCFRVALIPHLATFKKLISSGPSLAGPTSTAADETDPLVFTFRCGTSETESLLCWEVTWRRLLGDNEPQEELRTIHAKEPPSRALLWIAHFSTQRQQTEKQRHVMLGSGGFPEGVILSMALPDEKRNAFTHYAMGAGDGVGAGEVVVRDVRRHGGLVGDLPLASRHHIVELQWSPSALPSSPSDKPIAAVDFMLTDVGGGSGLTTRSSWPSVTAGAPSSLPEALIGRLQPHVRWTVCTVEENTALLVCVDTEAAKNVLATFRETADGSAEAPMCYCRATSTCLVSGSDGGKDQPHTSGVWTVATTGTARLMEVLRGMREETVRCIGLHDVIATETRRATIRVASRNAHRLTIASLGGRGK